MVDENELKERMMKVYMVMREIPNLTYTDIEKMGDDALHALALVVIESYKKSKSR